MNEIDLWPNRQRAQEHLDSLPFAFLARAGKERRAAQASPRVPRAPRASVRTRLDGAHDFGALLRALCQAGHDHERHSLRRHGFERMHRVG